MKFTMAPMTPAEAGTFLRRLAETTAGRSRSWDDFEAIVTQFITDAYKAGQSAHGQSPLDDIKER